MLPISKTGIGVHTKHEFLPSEPFLRFSQRTCPIYYFRHKTHVGVVSRNFVTARHPFQKWESGCIQSMSFLHREPFHRFSQRTFPIRKRVLGCIKSICFCHRNHFFVFRNEHAQSTTLGPKLMLGWFCAISLPHVTHYENGYRGAYKA
jgi:hypothetical protein